MEKYEEVIKVSETDNLYELFGIFDENINALMAHTGATIFLEDNKIVVNGDKPSVILAVKVIEKLLKIINVGEKVDKSRIVYLVDLARNGELDNIESVVSGVVAVNSRGKQIKCKTLGQKKYVDAIKKNTVSFGVGPAGTGKTYLAVALAVTAFKNKEIEKIILTRPAVEAGEKLGFLPGDLQNKVDPYLRPLYDALQEMFGLETYQKLMEKGSIEIAPLAYMRGRTLNNSFIILDEAQNTTKEQMKMFLTRLGENSKAVITGDVTQIDLPSGKTSGLKHAVSILKDISGIEIINLTYKDVVRHPLVAEIIKAYQTSENKKQTTSKGNKNDKSKEN